MPYPSSPGAVAPLLDEFPVDSLAYEFLEWYGDEQVNEAWMAQHVMRAVQWAEQYGVDLTCNEFGVYKPVSPRADLLSWHADIRQLFEDHGIGWSKWEYDEGFGIVTYEDGEFSGVVVDEELVAALGLPAESRK